MMLKQADGSYACVAESTSRFTLGEVDIFFKLQATFFSLGFLQILNMLLYLLFGTTLDQRRIVEGAGNARRRRKLTRIPPQRLQGSVLIEVVSLIYA